MGTGDGMLLHRDRQTHWGFNEQCWTGIWHHLDCLGGDAEKCRAHSAAFIPMPFPSDHIGILERWARFTVSNIVSLQLPDWQWMIRFTLWHSTNLSESGQPHQVIWIEPSKVPDMRSF